MTDQKIFHAMQLRHPQEQSIEEETKDCIITPLEVLEKDEWYFAIMQQNGRKRFFSLRARSVRARNLGSGKGERETRKIELIKT